MSELSRAEPLPLTPTKPGFDIAGEARAFLGQPAVRKSMPLIVAAMAVAGMILLYSFVRGVDYRPLFPNLAEEDKAAVVEALTAANYDVEIDEATGAVAVAASDYHKARMLLASQGLPKAAATGYDLLNDMPLGSSRALEAARLKQSQESELARSVAEISGVESARVHLALPEQSVFVRERTPPTASVFLRLSPGRALGEAQVRSIVHLVSSSVPGLSADSVSVVDQSGALLSTSGGADGLGESQRRVAYQSTLEDMYRKRLASLLTPMLGPDNFTAEVHFDLDFTAREATREAYDKNNAVLRSEQSSLQLEGGAVAAPRGIPGALSNQPPAAATVVTPPPAAGAAAPAGVAAAVPAPMVESGPRNENVTRSYEVGKEVSVTRTLAGEIRRASVAVVVRELPDKKLSRGDLRMIEQLVRSAVGIDPQRGDVVTVTARPFIDMNTVIEPLPWYRQDWVMTQSKNLGFVLVAAMLIFGLLKPMMKRTLARTDIPAALASPLQIFSPEPVQQQDRAPRVPRRSSIPPELLTAAKDYDEKVALVRMFVSDDTARASSVLKSMMRTDMPTGSSNE